MHSHILEMIWFPGYSLEGGAHPIWQTVTLSSGPTAPHAAYFLDQVRSVNQKLEETTSHCCGTTSRAVQVQAPQDVQVQPVISTLTLTLCVRSAWTRTMGPVWVLSAFYSVLMFVTDQFTCQTFMQRNTTFSCDYLGKMSFVAGEGG